MPMNIEIQDGIGNGYVTEVAYTNALRVYTDTPPLDPIGTLNRKHYYKSVLSGMNVNGSVTPVQFTVSAATDADIFITRIVWVVSDATMTLAKFGGLSRLTNGVDLIVVENGIETSLVSKAKTNGELMIEMGFDQAFGQTTGVNTMTSWSSTSDAAIAVMDVGAIMGGGLRIGRGSKDKIYVAINDNLTGLDEHFVQFYGYKLYE